MLIPGASSTPDNVSGGGTFGKYSMKELIEQSR